MKIWHPFTQSKVAIEEICIERGEGAYLYSDTGKKYLDLISSWWVNLHGHAHPKIASAIASQAAKLEHVIFAGFTHKPATELAQKMSKILPKGLSRIFFSDNGSTAVEVALKIALQYWHNKGSVDKQRFIAFKGGYHGDTFGAMSIGKTSGFYAPFEKHLFDVDFADYPSTWIGDEDVETKERAALKQLEQLLSKNTAALIIEPLIQGASGFRFVRSEFLEQVLLLCKSHDVLVIFDEVMTGFGRTGEMFASIKANVTPDILCVAKGLTGGFLPLACTVTSDEIYDAFVSDDLSKTFLHGHSYTANPLGCAAAIASLGLFEEEKTLQKIAAIENVHLQRAPKLNACKVRIMGDIAAFNIGNDDSYFAKIGSHLKEQFLTSGLLLRPLGNVVYFIPPYCISSLDLHSAYDIVESILGNLKV